MRWTLVDCSSATLSGPYTYSVSTPAPIGSTMSVNCSAGYKWSGVPYNGPQNATCTNVSNSGQWVISNGLFCLCKPNFTYIHIEYLVNSYESLYNVVQCILKTYKGTYIILRVKMK